MNPSQKQAWASLKLAADKYSQTTGAEVAVVTTFFPINKSNENCLSFGDAKLDTSIYGHGNLYKEVKESLELTRNESSLSNSWSKPDKFTKTSSFGSTNDGKERSFSSSFRTLKLDPHLTINPETPTPVTHQIDSSHGRSGRKKSKKKKAQTPGELELDESLLFGEEEVPPSSGDDSSEDSDDNEEYLGQLPPRRVFNAPPGGQFGQLASSVPVNIAMNWGVAPNRFRDNQGPRQPTYDQPTSAVQSNPRVIRAEPTPQPDTMMASMQALARSVTDDTALIFGERPRPRVLNEPIRTRNKK